ncbi:MAG: hypothetical protein GX597_13720 [Anaerolineaceae bacterium]|nr:hypothetical protein [Anaerolineaceae bacterium]
MAATGGHWIKSARGGLGFVPAEASKQQPKAEPAYDFAPHDALLIRGTRAHGNEMGYVVFSDGTVSKAVTGGKSSISSVKLRQVSGLRPTEGAVFSHTHPSGRIGTPHSTFSPADISFAAYHNLAEIRAVSVGGDGTVKIYSMKRGPKGWPSRYTIKHDFSSHMRQLNARARAVGMGNAEWYHAHEVYWQEYAKAWGLTYEEHYQ